METVCDNVIILYNITILFFVTAGLTSLYRDCTEAFNTLVSSYMEGVRSISTEMENPLRSTATMKVTL